MKRSRTMCTLVITSVLALTACSLASITVPPAMPSSDHYGVTLQPAKTVEAAGVTQQFDVGAVPMSQWWKLYRSDALNVLVEEGLRGNPALAAIQKTLPAAQEELYTQMGASALPSLDAGAQAVCQRTPNLTGVGPRALRYNAFVDQLQAHYTLDSFDITRYANAASTAWIDVRGCELGIAWCALVANTVGAVINAAALDQQVALTKRLVVVADATTRGSQRRYELGALPHTQMLASTQDAVSLVATLPQLRQQCVVSIHVLAMLLGRTSDTTPAVPEFSSLSLPSQVSVTVSSDLLCARPNIRTAAAVVGVASANAGKATAQPFPSLSLTALLGRGGLNRPALLSGMGGLWAVGAKLSQPIFHSGALMTHRHATLELYDATVPQYKSVVLSVFENAADTLAVLESDIQTLVSTEVASTTVRTAFSETAPHRRLGVLSASVEQSSELQYLNAQPDTVRATSRHMSDTTALLQAMGELPVDTVQAIVRD